MLSNDLEKIAEKILNKISATKLKFIDVSYADMKEIEKILLDKKTNFINLKLIKKNIR